MTAQQLKNSILQLAVQGKLVPQDPNDEPASVLLERIRKEKEALIKAKKIKKEKNPSVIFRGADNTPYEKIGNEVVPLDVPFDIPDSWEWVRGSSLGEIVRGSGIKRTETTATGFPCVRYGEIYTTYNTSFTEVKSFIPDEVDKNCKHFSFGDVLMTLTGENKPDIAKAVVYLGNELVAAGGDLAFWTHHGLNPLYLVYLLNSPYVINKKVKLATGDIIVHISGDKIASILLPIPPLNEQNRIVQSIQELEVIVSEYGKKERAITELQTAFPDQLKKSILQWAVQGKLVPQNENDEPAEVLLKHIRAEKEALIKAGKIKRDKNESIIFRRDNSHYEKLAKNEVCIEDEIPYDIPISWCWVRLSNIVYNHGQKTPDKVFSYIDIGSIDNKNQVLNSQESWVEPNKAASRARKKVEIGDILYSSVRPYLHNMCIVDREFEKEPIASTGFAVMACHNGIYNKFLFYYLLSPWFDAYANHTDNAKGVAYPAINDDRLYRALVPIPPLSEQYRIVAKIEELMPLIKVL